MTDQRLVDALRRVLTCSACKGKGKIWVKGSPDKLCQCRFQGFQLLREVEDVGSKDL